MRRGKPWRTRLFVAATRRCRCAPRCRCSCPIRWPSSCAPPPSRPPNRPASSNSRHRSRNPSRAAVSTGRRCSSCAPSPAASARRSQTASDIQQRGHACRAQHRRVGAHLVQCDGRATPPSARRPPTPAPTSSGCTGSSVAAATPIGTASASSSAQVGATYRDASVHGVGQRRPLPDPRSGQLVGEPGRARCAHLRRRRHQPVAAQHVRRVPGRQRGGRGLRRARPRRQCGQHGDRMRRMGQRPIDGHRGADGHPAHHDGAQSAPRCPARRRTRRSVGPAAAAVSRQRRRHRAGRCANAR